MKWEDLRRSSNIEDLRSKGPARGFGGGGRNIFPIVQFLMGTKIGRIVLVIGVIAYFLGFNPLSLLDSRQEAPKTQVVASADNKTAEFVSAVLGQTEDVWHKLFAQEGLRYEEPKLVLFRGSVNSGCGYASAQMGPFYCPNDKKVYLDMSFFDELKRRHNAPGDFAQAYVIAHEVGHHVQNLLGTLDKSHSAKASSSKTQANAVQVKVELQADCYSGVWAHYLGAVLEDGDIEEALGAASAIGDDTLQKQAQGYVVPDAFTHGSSVDRVKWFKLGYKGGELRSCQTGI
ncbi:zinc metallopeptidase [bacterium]|nr:zinc metallopeptidase [bacterium]MBU1434234.1 zinc metallopeptidase [bacterium]MBU1504329.1 zinc metallopeptidase [bacterium]